jgi:hypothetical protein
VNSQIVGEWKSTRGPEHLVGSGHCGSTDAGSTHAWAEVYVPGAGWITFDPTNRSVGGFNLIPVAVARDIRQAMPVAGSFVGTTDAFQGLCHISRFYLLMLSSRREPGYGITMP